MKNLLRVDVGTGSVVLEELPEEYRVLGGRALTSSIIAKEVDATADPLGPDNKIVFAPGILGGTKAPNSGRLSVGCKSPLTGGIKEANAGGQAGTRLGRLGIAAIVVEGDPAGRKWILHIDEEGEGKLRDGTAYWGLANYECAERLRNEFGGRVASILTGPAGEMGYRNSSVAVTDVEGRPARHAGRGGVGAVMAARGLKAIVIADTRVRRNEPVNPERFEKARKTLVEGVKQHPVTSAGLTNLGTAILVNIINEAGGLPTRNFRLGRFDKADAISGETLAEKLKERGGDPSHACMPGCLVRCSNVCVNEAGEYVSSGFEYETIWSLGANCDNGDLDAIMRMDRLCDDLGLDTIEMGATFAVAMEAGVLPWGDAGRMIELLDADIRKGTDLGVILGNGCARAGAEWGVERVPAVKRQSMSGYDPRAIKGLGVTYATSPMGADHTSGQAAATNILQIGGYLHPHVIEGQAELSKGLQEATASAFDSTGLCLMLAFPCLDQPDSYAAIPEMISSLLGIDFSATDLGAMGTDLLALERDFNRRAGIDKSQDRLPGFMCRESLSPHDVLWDVPDENLDSICS